MTPYHTFMAPYHTFVWHRTTSDAAMLKNDCLKYESTLFPFISAARIFTAAQNCQRRNPHHIMSFKYHLDLF